MDGTMLNLSGWVDGSMQLWMCEAKLHKGPYGRESWGRFCLLSKKEADVLLAEFATRIQRVIQSAEVLRF
jgi:hypothetical protein